MKIEFRYSNSVNDAGFPNPLARALPEHPRCLQRCNRLTGASVIHMSESTINLDEERALAERALQAIGILSVMPQSTIPQDTIEILRQACRVAADLDTTLPGHRGRALNTARDDVGLALPVLIRAVEGTLTPEIIENARCAVAQWKTRLEEPGR